MTPTRNARGVAAYREDPYKTGLGQGFRIEKMAPVSCGLRVAGYGLKGSEYRRQMAEVFEFLTP